MADYNSLAIYDIREYLWDNLKSSGVLNEQDYYADGFNTPIIPIIPSQQVPEMNNLLPGKPYIVYEYETLPIGPDWWISEEIATFLIYSTDYDKINSIMTLMIDIFRRYDASASEIRQFNIQSSNFEFYYTAIDKIKFVEEPSRHEGGIKTGLANILYAYARRTQDSGRF